MRAIKVKVVLCKDPALRAYHGPPTFWIKAYGILIVGSDWRFNYSFLLTAEFLRHWNFIEIWSCSFLNSDICITKLQKQRRETYERRDRWKDLAFLSLCSGQPGDVAEILERTHLLQVIIYILYSKLYNPSIAGKLKTITQKSGSRCYTEVDRGAILSPVSNSHK